MSPQLTKREYLGEGYHHQFINDKTGMHVYVQCTKEEYFELGQKNIKPTLKDFVWVASTGGTYKVDTSDGRLGENEYCEISTDVVVRLGGVDSAKAWQKIPRQSIEENKIIEQVWQLL